MYHFFFTHLSASRHLCGLHVFAIVNSAAMNPGVHESFWIIVFSGYMPWNGIAGSYGINSSVYCFLRNLYFLLHHGYTHLHSHHSRRRVPFSHYPLQHLFIDYFLTFVCIYFLLCLFLDYQFLFLSFLLGYLFLLHNLLFWFRNNVLLQLASSQCGREGSLVGWSDHESLSPVLPPGVFVHLNVLNDQRIYVFALKFSTLCMCVSMCSKNSALFLGHWPCVQPHCLACAHLPAPRWNDGMAHIACLLWHPSDTWWLFRYAYT